MTPSFLTRAFIFLQALDACRAFAFQNTNTPLSSPLPTAVYSTRMKFFSTTESTIPLPYRTVDDYDGVDSSATELFQEMDLDENGKVSFDELDLHLSSSGLYDTTGLIVKPIFEKMDLNADGELSFNELESSLLQYFPDLQTSKYFIDEVYEDMARLFQSVTAHGDGTIHKDLLTEHLVILSQDEENTEASERTIRNILALLDDDDNNEQEYVTLNDVTVAFIRYYALQRALYGSREV